MKFLLIQLRRIGDVLMTTPSVRLLHESFPEAKLTFMTEAPADQVLRNNPYLDEILLYQKSESFSDTISFFRNLRVQQFDCVIDFFGNPRSALMSRFSGAPIRIGFGFRGRSWAYTHPVNISTEVTYAAQDKAQLLSPLGISATDFGLDFFADEKDKNYAARLFDQLGITDSDFVVSLSPVSRRPYKVWPAERFAWIADWLVQKYNAKILFLFGPGEVYFIDAVRKAMKNQALPDYDFPTLTETLAILNRVNLHLGNDNGPRHFAVAGGTPTLTIFGRPWAANWTPPQTTKHRTLEFDPGCKNKCTYPKCKLECLLGVTVEAVQTELEKMINTFS
ncbi:MAG TPA: glycosyltransferase family 9 protein [Candidatus Lambdaproteobacteria bacterium]|nr:glycosyltransferase family 9 protein [Candidatus Lambdaproteobacteria bacterium]